MKIKILFAFLLVSICAFGQQGPIQIDPNGLTQTFGAGGIVTRGQIVKINSSGQVVPVLTTDTSGAIGIAATSQQNVGQVVAVSLAGSPLVQIDASGCTAGNIVSFSTTTGGAGHCAATAVGQQVGVAISVSSPGSNFWNVQLNFSGSGGLAPSTPLPASSSGPGPVFNVKNYGAKGDSRTSINASISGSTITCSDCNFTQADVGRSSSFAIAPATTDWSNVTISSVTNSTTASIAPSSFGPNAGTLTWGTIDDTAVSAAVTAFLAAAQQQAQAVTGIATASPTLYFPTGAYSLLNTAIFLNPASVRNGLAIRGDGSYQTRIIGLTGYTPARLLVMANMANTIVQGITFDGMGGTAGNSNNAIDTSSATSFIDVAVRAFANNGINFTGAGLYMNASSIISNLGFGLVCSSCNGTVENSIISNNGPNIKVVNSTGLPGGFGIKFVAIQQDECTNAPCMQVINSQDVWLVGSSVFGTTSSSGIQIDGLSSVHMNGGLVGPFAQDTNGTGVTILSGGIFEASDVRFVSTGTGKCINNSGTFINNGSNTCESMFNTISAAASAGTTATLTVVSGGANVSAVCAVNDSVYVQNVGVAGYNGFFKNKVTAVGTTTLSYTTPGSNLGASSGGSVFCRSYNNYSGSLPYSALTPTPNTCYVTGTFGAITLCNQFIDRAINIYHIKASSGVTTACTVAPVVTISDGTNSATLTITTAKSTWDSAVDASTNVGTLIFTPDGGTLTVSTTAGTCTTPPTNFALTYTMQGVMDN